MLRRLLLSVLLFASLCMSGCRASTSEATFILSDKGKEVHQNPYRLPLLVYVHPEAAHWAGEAAAAADYWNRHVGSPVFLFVGVQKEDDIYVTPGVVSVFYEAMMKNRALTVFTVREENGEMESVGVILPDHDLDPLVAVLLVIHEFGHVLGLDHDEDLPESIMHPTLVTTKARPTETDLQALRARYRVRSI